MAFLEVKFFSDVLGMCTQMNVILPERPETEKVPVVFLLHGMSDDHTAWCRFTSIERYARERGIAVVMPTTHLGWYTDMYMGPKYFTYITKELPEICRSFFPRMDLSRETTFAAGLSMGGYGAWKCALSAPETFSAAVSLSGALDVAGLWQEKTLIEEEGIGYWTDVFGPLEDAPGGKDDLMAEAERLKASGRPLPRLFAWCGTEDFLYQNNLGAWEKMKALGYEVTTRISGGDHRWKYWDEHIQEGLDWLGFPVKGGN